MVTPRSPIREPWVVTVIASVSVLVVTFLVSICCIGGVLYLDYAANRPYLEPEETDVGGIKDVGWAGDGYLYLARGGGDFWRMKPGGGEWEEVLPPSGGMCGADPALVEMESSSDGRLLMVLRCADGSRTVSTFESLPEYSDEETLLTTALPVGGATWDPRARRGLVTTDDEDCVGFTTFRGPGDEPSPPPVGKAGAVGRLTRAPVVGGRSWPLDAPLFRTANDDCAELGMAGWPRVRPGSPEVVFLAAPHAPPVRDATTSSRWEKSRAALYSWDLVSASAYEIASGFNAPKAMELSADGRYVAVAADRDGGPGAWLVDLGTGKVVRVASGEFWSLSFSPKGDQLAAVEDGKLIIVDL